MLLFSVAFAAPVLYVAEEGPDAAIAKVALHDKQPLSQLEAVQLSEVAQDDAPRLLGGSFSGCNGETTTRPAMKALVDEAEGALAYMDVEQAATSLAHAMAGEPCLDEPVDPAVASRAHFLYGIVSIKNGDKPQAWESFQRAASYDPNMAWDEAFPPDGRSTFDAALAELKSVEARSFRVVGGDSVVVDGQAASAFSDLKPGPHLVQVQVDGAWVGLLCELTAATDATLVFPAALTEAHVAAVNTDAGRAELGAVLHALGGADTWYVSLPDGLWKLDPATETWTDVLAPDVAAPADPDPVAEARPLPVDKALIGVGGAALAGGAIVMGVTWSQGRTAWDQADQAQTVDAWDGAEQDYIQAQSTWRKGAVVAGVGGAAVAGGVAMTRMQVSAGPTHVGVTWSY